MPDPTFTMSADAIVEVRVIQELFSQRLLNVFHYRAADTFTTSPGWQAYADIEAIFTDVDDSVLRQMSLNQVDALKYKYVQVQLIHPFRYVFRSFVPTSISEGTLTDPVQTANTAFSVTLRGDFAIKSRTGRKQFGGVSQGNVSAGKLTSLAQIAADELAQKMKENITISGGDLKPIILNRVLPSTSRVITSAQVQDTVRDQRTRTVGQGI